MTKQQKYLEDIVKVTTNIAENTMTGDNTLAIIDDWKNPLLGGLKGQLPVGIARCTEALDAIDALSPVWMLEEHLLTEESRLNWIKEHKFETLKAIIKFNDFINVFYK